MRRGELDKDVLGGHRTASLAHSWTPIGGSSRSWLWLGQTLTSQAEAAAPFFTGVPSIFTYKVRNGPWQVICATLTSPSILTCKVRNGSWQVICARTNLRVIQFLLAWCCSLLPHTRKKHHVVDEPDIVPLPPSAVLDAQMPASRPASRPTHG